MPDLIWPADLAPFRVAFYLQPHVGGQESPLTRTRKVYGLGAPRWIAKLTFRGGVDGVPRFGDQDGFGPRLDSLIADLQGGLNTVRFHDWRRPYPLLRPAVRGPIVSQGAAKGATAMRVSGFAPGAPAFALGDYLGGDGRPHLVSAANTIAAGGVVSGAGSVMADANGVALVGFNPPLSADIAAGASMVWPVTAPFQLQSPDDAPDNETEVGEAQVQTLAFFEVLP